MDQPRRWNVFDAHAAAPELAERLGTSPLVAQILLNRGLDDCDVCRDFLRPTLRSLLEPETIPNLRVAAERIAKSIRDREKIVIYGDYDVDGITATAILWHAIRQLGGIVEYYIPHRIDEGYGLNSQAIEQICSDGARLIVTVDCGVTAIEPAKVARDRGVDLIVTDHHEWRTGAPGADGSVEPILPGCWAVVHPRLPHTSSSPSSPLDPYGNPHLCGAGVAFKLAWEVGKVINGANRVGEAFREFLLEATALAALGTIADVVPLVGENRVLAHFGLGGLKHSRLVGIRALIASAGLDGQKLDSYHVGFLLAPRLNACGRMGHARLAVEMLTEAGATRAEEIATYLEQQNRQRQAIERSIVEQAIEQAQRLGMDRGGHDGGGNRAIVLAGEGWHPGVIGIVASRMVDRYHRPAILVSLNGEHGQGSGRSIGGFHLARALESCGEHLDAFGGHEMAAGLRVRTENFQKFQRAFLDHANQAIAPEQLIPELKLDCLAELRHVTLAAVSDLKRLGPFGHGNRKPLLCCRQVQLAGPPRRVGKTGDHLQLFVRQGNTHMKCIAFGRGDLFDQLQPGQLIDLAVEPQINEYNGTVSVELDVKDIALAQA